MPINEPRIYTKPPAWAGLTEIERTAAAVWFRTRTGRIRATLAEVEAYERKNSATKSTKKKSGL